MALSCAVPMVTVPPVRVIAGFLLALASVMVVEAVRAFRMPQVAPENVILANGDIRPATI